MSELTNLEVCKRIAEIEGRLVSNYKLCTDDVWVHTCDTRNSSVTLYNPFDNALCLNLAFKYHVSIHYASGKVFISDSDRGSFTVKFDINRLESLLKAILLCIIEAHKDQS